MKKEEKGRKRGFSKEGREKGREREKGNGKKTLKSNIKIVGQKVKSRITLWFSNFTIAKQFTGEYTKLYFTLMFMTVLFGTAKM